jgi:23S rRNA pseudouridine1911/1915/1917 synthase
MDNQELKILFEDNHVIVCIKPPGVLSQADGLDRQDMLTIIKEYLREKYNKPGNVYLGLVHRLDYNVGGVMVFAKTSKAASRLSESMRIHDFTKEYYAVLEADLAIGKTDVLIDYIAKDENQKLAYITDETKGKLSKLEYEVIDKMILNNKTLTLVNVTLISGRFHQIRLQFSSRNMPLYGDTKYGHRTREKDKELGLYAFQLSFPHPITQEVLTYRTTPNTPLFQLFKL